MIHEWKTCIDDFPYVITIAQDKQTQLKFNLKCIIEGDVSDAFTLNLRLLAEPAIWNSIPSATNKNK